MKSPSMPTDAPSVVSGLAMACDTVRTQLRAQPGSHGLCGLTLLAEQGG